MAETFTAVFSFFLSGNAAVWGRARLPELLVNHHSSEGLNYLVLSVLVFVTGLAQEEAKNGSAVEMNLSWIRKLNETAPISRKSRGATP